MGIFDSLTGAPGVAAADASRNYLGGLQNNLINATGIVKDQNAGTLTTGFNDARNALTTGYNTATGNINNGANNALGYLDTGTTGATDALGAARNALTANGGAFAPLSDLAARYGTGADMYANSLGLNGPQGNQAALDAFHAGPSYNWQLDQGIDALNRRANAGGMLQGGNANRDAITFGQGLANKEYGNWQNQLAAFNPLQLSATQGAATGNAGVNNAVAGIDTSLASLLSGAGAAKANVATGQATSLADLARALYGGEAGLDTGLASALSGNNTDALKTATGVGLNVAPQVTKSYNDAAAAEMAGSANTLNLGMNLAKLATGAFGGLGGFGLFGSGSGTAAGVA